MASIARNLRETRCRAYAGHRRPTRPSRAPGSVSEPVFARYILPGRNALFALIIAFPAVAFTFENDGSALRVGFKA